MGSNPGQPSDLKTDHLVRQSAGGEGHLIAAADARALQSYGHDRGNGAAGDGMEEDLDGAVEGEAMEGDVAHDHGGLGDQNAIIVPPVASNQLTLSFHGEVYVFDSVSPEKVTVLRAVSGSPVDRHLIALCVVYFIGICYFFFHRFKLFFCCWGDGKLPPPRPQCHQHLIN